MVGSHRLCDLRGRTAADRYHHQAQTDGYAFPSAHAATAAAALGVAACLCAGLLRSWRGRVAVWAGAAMLAALVGISRVYLGVHWTTDVLGGWAFGVLWLAVVVGASAMVIRHGGIRESSAIDGSD